MDKEKFKRAGAYQEGCTFYSEGTGAEIVTFYHSTPDQAVALFRREYGDRYYFNRRLSVPTTTKES